jgi:hypothetical protein
MSDFVREMINLLDSTPRTAWDVQIRLAWGGDRPYIARRDPLPTERVREWIRMGYAERTARMKVRGK